MYIVGGGGEEGEKPRIGVNEKRSMLEEHTLENIIK